MAPTVAWPVVLCLDELIPHDRDLVGVTRVREDIRRLRATWQRDLREQATFRADRATNVCLDKLDFLVGELIDGLAMGHVLAEPVAPLRSRASRRRQRYRARHVPAVDPDFCSVGENDLTSLWTQAQEHYQGAVGSGSWTVRIPPGQEIDEGFGTKYDFDVFCDEFYPQLSINALMDGFASGTEISEESLPPESDLDDLMEEAFEEW